MGYGTRTGLGLALMVGGVAGLAYCIVELASIGTCASGGPYVSARECPAGTEWFIIGIFPAVIGFLVGAGIFASRGGRSTKPGLPPTGEATLANPVPFGTVRPNAGVPSPPTAAPDPLERIEHLAQLKQSGVLTQAEFEAQKALILNQ
jgi:hypothetical protein